MEFGRPSGSKKVGLSKETEQFLAGAFCCGDAF
jgi:hypothetical protein